jgi:hypothetical protein
MRPSVFFRFFDLDVELTVIPLRSKLDFQIFAFEFDFNLRGPRLLDLDPKTGGRGSGLKNDLIAMTGTSQVGTQMMVQSGSVATGSVSLDERAWGTAITLDLQDLPPNDSYVAWAVDKSGEWQQVASWGPTPNSSAHVSGASSL